jgi:hypothetical protein
MLKASVIPVPHVHKMVPYMLKASVMPVLHVHKMVPSHVEGKCNPCAACS